ncbi:DUF6049 family protein [Ruania suaedae]|uniref:DUF6049 family protein n=1 Tax=Ruania suaedae TaxID=2897774 RepID=UPI001E3A8157|nr:DUF6049 family protein [Ruania suaedae]UFU03025.1 DUF6049 family protein [Ruania suaedae]
MDEPDRTHQVRARLLARWCALTLVLVVLGAGLVAPGGTLGTVPAAAAPVPGEVTLELTEISPAVTRPGDDIEITGTLANGTDEPLTAPRIQLVLQLHVPATRGALDSWLADENSFNAQVFAVEYLPDDVPADASVPFSIVVPADRSPFGAGSAWGPRGIEVRAVSQGQALAGERSALLWYPDEPQLSAPTELSVLAPLTPTPQEWSASVDQGVPVLEESAPRLAQVLEQMPDDVAWALDAALLESVPADVPVSDAGEQEETGDTAPDEMTPSTTEDGTADPDTTTGEEATTEESPDAPTGDADETEGTEDTEGGDGTEDPTDTGETSETEDSEEPVTASSVLEGLIDGAAERDLIALGYADADQSVLQGSAGGSLLRAGDERARALLAEHGVLPLEDVTWPASADASSVAALAAVDTRAVVLPAQALPPLDQLSYTPSGRTRIETAAGPLEALLWDEGLSAVLTADASALQVRQTLLAQTAVIARERPADARGLLAALPRDLGADSEELAAATSALTSLEQAPWVETTNLRSLLGRTDTGEVREVLSPSPTSGSPLSAGTVADLDRAWSNLDAFSQVTDEPAQFRDDLAPQILTGLSSALTRAPQTRSTVVSTALEASADLTTQIRVEPGSEVLLVAASGEIPITIESGLAVGATVAVRLVPQDPRLRAEETVLTQIPPGGATTARLPVTAVANGNVDVSVEILTAPQGEVLTEADPFRVRVRADWENTGTAIIAGVLLLGLAFGIARTIRKGQRRYEPAARSDGSA